MIKIMFVCHGNICRSPMAEFVMRDMLKKEGFSKDVLAALVCITKKKGEDYGDFINRVLTNPLATQIKLYDIEDNLNRDRIPFPTERDEARFAKYQKYHEIIVAKLMDYQNSGSYHINLK